MRNILTRFLQFLLVITIVFSSSVITFSKEQKEEYYLNVKEVVAPRYKSIGSFSNGVAIAKRAGKYVLVSNTGKELSKLYKKIYRSYGYYVFQTGKKKHIANSAGKILLSVPRNSWFYLDNSYWVVKKGKKMSIYNRYGGHIRTMKKVDLEITQVAGRTFFVYNKGKYYFDSVWYVTTPDGRLITPKKKVTDVIITPTRIIYDGYDIGKSYVYSFDGKLIFSTQEKIKKIKGGYKILRNYDDYEWPAYKGMYFRDENFNKMFVRGGNEIAVKAKYEVGNYKALVEKKGEKTNVYLYTKDNKFVRKFKNYDVDQFYLSGTASNEYIYLSKNCKHNEPRKYLLINASTGKIIDKGYDVDDVEKAVINGQKRLILRSSEAVRTKVIDYNGKKIFSTNKFSNLRLIYGNRFIAGERGRKYLLNANAKKYTKKVFESINFINSNRFIGIVDGEYALYDGYGKKLSADYEYLKYIGSDRYKVRKNKKYGVIDSNGKKVTDVKYMKINHFRFGLARVKDELLYGYINLDGKEVVPLKYDNASEKLKNGYAIIESSSLQGAINRNGEIIIPVKYQKLSKVTSWPYVAKTVENGRAGLFYLGGTEFNEPEYDDIKPFYCGIKRYKVGNKWGVMGPDGRKYIEPKYDYIKSLNKIGFAFANKGGMIYKDRRYRWKKSIYTTKVRGGKWGLIGRDGREYIKPKYDKLSYAGDGVIRAEKDGKYGMIFAKWYKK